MAAKASMTNAVSAELQAVARRLLNANAKLDASARVWAVAVLVRQALEQAVAAFWIRRQAGVGLCFVRTQISCVAAYDGQTIAAQASSARAVLAGLCHHHPYELAASSEELAAAIGGVETACSAEAERQ